MQSPPAFDLARSVFVYADPLRDLILRFKHGDNLYLAPLFGNWLHQGYLSYYSHLPPPQMIIPIPLHRKKLIHRQYNQAALIARQLQKHTKLPMVTDLLVRSKATKPQGHLSKKMRAENLKNAFTISQKSSFMAALPKTVLLIDDVMTSGATLHQAARCLKRAGIERVTCLTLARVDRN
ncbi:MAG: ComF family protein [Alphaproteobacteria bacterium]|nr:ComF family protein [Alphaproteobacteria bacterium]